MAGRINTWTSMNQNEISGGIANSDRRPKLNG